MHNLFLPDVMMARAAKRLHAMADAIERGETLTDIAAQFRIPIRALRRVAAPPPRKPPTHRVPAISQVTLAQAAHRIRSGATYGEVAAELKVSVSTLIKVVTKGGVTMKGIRKASSDKGLARAVELYRQGVKVSAISEQTGVPGMTIYRHLKQQEGLPLRQIRRKATPSSDDGTL